jgi:hypothetical protein
MSYDLRFEGGERQELYLAPRRQDRKGRSLGDPSSWRSPRLGARIGFSLRLRAVRALRVWVVGNYAKRTQFGRVKWAEQTHSEEARPASGGSNVQNEANPRPCRRGEGRGANARHRLDAPLRETKPNQGKLGVWGTGRRWDEHRANAPNKANSARVARQGRGWPGEPAGARRRQTKPIPGGAKRRASAWRERIYGE